MENSIIIKEGEDPLQALKKFMAHFSTIQKVLADYECLQQKVSELEEANAELTKKNAELADSVEQWKKGDEWSNRVTYDNVVDQIASNEDAAQRDLARKLIEPLLKRAQVTQLRKDIKRRVKELNEESAGIVIEQAEVTVNGNWQDIHDNETVHL